MSEKTAASLLEMNGISKSFGATVALDGVNLSVEAGQVCALVGENGAGKSTLMKILSGAVMPDEGSMQIAGADFQPRNPLDARKSGVAMIYQELSLVPHLSVQENILLGMEPTKLGFMNYKSIRQTAVSSLAQLDHPEIKPDVRVGNLSVGAQQLVEIARAISFGCRVLVFDEPTSSLAHRDVERLFDLIGRLKARGHAIVYISHFIEEVKEIADKFTVLRDGRTVGSGQIATTTSDEIVALMVGRKLEQLYPKSKRIRGDVVLEIESLAGIKKPVEASLEVHAGEVVGIAGLVGAGRTELMRSIFGLDAVRSGKIRVGTFTGPASPAKRWSQAVGLVSEDRKDEGLALSLSLTDNTTLSNLKGFGPFGLVLPSAQSRAAKRWIDELKIKCRSASQPVGGLSGGNQQKVALARLLQHDVDILLLDEPTRGIDVGSKALIYQIIDDIASGKGAYVGRPKAVLVVSSYLPELFGICDRIAVMCRGKLGPARDVSQLNEHQVMMEATGSEVA